MPLDKKRLAASQLWVRSEKDNLVSWVWPGAARQVKWWQFSGNRALEELQNCSVPFSDFQVWLWAVSFQDYCKTGEKWWETEQVKIPQNRLFLVIQPLLLSKCSEDFYSFCLISRVLKHWFLPVFLFFSEERDFGGGYSSMPTDVLTVYLLHELVSFKEYIHFIHATDYWYKVVHNIFLLSF